MLLFTMAEEKGERGKPKMTEAMPRWRQMRLRRKAVKKKYIYIYTLAIPRYTSHAATQQNEQEQREEEAKKKK